MIVAECDRVINVCLIRAGALHARCILKCYLLNSYESYSLSKKHRELGLFNWYEVVLNVCAHTVKICSYQTRFYLIAAHRFAIVVVFSLRKVNRRTHKYLSHNIRYITFIATPDDILKDLLCGKMIVSFIDKYCENTFKTLFICKTVSICVSI